MASSGRTGLLKPLTKTSDTTESVTVGKSSLTEDRVNSAVGGLIRSSALKSASGLKPSRIGMEKSSILKSSLIAPASFEIGHETKSIAKTDIKQAHFNRLAAGQKSFKFTGMNSAMFSLKH